MPGPIATKMAGYVGFKVAGWPGAAATTWGDATAAAIQHFAKSIREDKEPLCNVDAGRAGEGADDRQERRRGQLGCFVYLGIDDVWGGVVSHGSRLS